MALHYDHLGGQDGFFRCCLLRVGIEHLLVPKSHLSAGVPWHIHPAEKYPILGLASAQFLRTCQLLASEQLGLDGGVVLLVDDVVDAVPVDQQVLHAVTQVLGGVLRDVKELASLGDHHHKPVESLQQECFKVSWESLDRPLSIVGHRFLVAIVHFIALLYLLWDTIKPDNGSLDIILHSTLLN